MYRTFFTRMRPSGGVLTGGTSGGRTHGLRIANAALSRLSYHPEVVELERIELSNSPCKGDVFPLELQPRNLVQHPRIELGRVGFQATALPTELTLRDWMRR
jgi:hypothetical protein